VTAPSHRPVLVVDFGAQYAQLIARRVREANVYSEIVPSSMPVAEMLAKDPAAVILSGGPSSVYAEGAPQVDPALFGTGVPTFGICYGFQAMAQALGGEVAQTGLSEFGGTQITVTDAGSALFAGTPETQTVWMSHGDAVHRAPDGFVVATAEAPLRPGSRTPRGARGRAVPSRGAAQRARPASARALLVRRGRLPSGLDYDERHRRAGRVDSPPGRVGTRHLRAVRRRRFSRGRGPRAAGRR
jgi:GMP synthase (glutamine-hydrolysing) A subunit